jgi:hypothetical protein
MMTAILSRRSSKDLDVDAGILLLPSYEGAKKGLKIVTCLKMSKIRDDHVKANLATRMEWISMTYSMTAVKKATFLCR